MASPSPLNAWTDQRDSETSSKSGADRRKRNGSVPKSEKWPPNSRADGDIVLEPSQIPLNPIKRRILEFRVGVQNSVRRLIRRAGFQKTSQESAHAEPSLGPTDTPEEIKIQETTTETSKPGKISKVREVFSRYPWVNDIRTKVAAGILAAGIGWFGIGLTVAQASDPTSNVNKAGSEMANFVGVKKTAYRQFNESQENLHLAEAKNGQLELEVKTLQKAESDLKLEVSGLRKQLSDLRDLLLKTEKRVTSLEHKVKKAKTDKLAAAPIKPKIDYFQHQKMSKAVTGKMGEKAEAKTAKKSEVAKTAKAKSVKKPQIAAKSAEKKSVVAQANKWHAIPKSAQKKITKAAPLISYDTVKKLAQNTEKNLSRPGLEIKTQESTWGRIKIWAVYNGYESKAFYTTTDKHQTRLTPAGMKAWAEDRLEYLSRFEAIEKAAKENGLAVKKKETPDAPYLAVSEAAQWKTRFLLIDPKLPKGSEKDFTIPKDDFKETYLSEVFSDKKEELQGKSVAKVEKPIGAAGVKWDDKTTPPKAEKNEPKVEAPKTEEKKFPETSKAPETPKDMTLEKPVEPKVEAPKTEEKNLLHPGEGSPRAAEKTKGDSQDGKDPVPVQASEEPMEKSNDPSSTVEKSVVSEPETPNVPEKTIASEPETPNVPEKDTVVAMPVSEKPISDTGLEDLKGRTPNQNIQDMMSTIIHQ